MLYTYNDRFIKYNNKCFSGFTPGYIIYPGFTVELSGTGTICIDPALGTPKNLTWQITQQDGSWTGNQTTHPGYPQYLSDCLPVGGPSAGIYSQEWSNIDAYTANTAIGWQSDTQKSNIIGIKSFDGFKKKSFTNSNSLRFGNIHYIPENAENLHNCENLTTITGLFQGSYITGNIIPFITAMQSVAPNLTGTSRVFYGCTSAADYAQAVAQYPSWF